MLGFAGVGQFKASKWAKSEYRNHHIRQYQLLVRRRKVSWAVFNQTVCALRFSITTLCTDAGGLEAMTLDNHAL
jgi:hypothetical protein